MALEPITRQEKIIAGQDLEPITRMEMFLKNFGGSGGGGGASSADVFIIHATIDETDTNAQLDKTTEQIYEAYQSGKYCLVYFDGAFVPVESVKTHGVEAIVRCCGLTFKGNQGIVVAISFMTNDGATWKIKDESPMLYNVGFFGLQIYGASGQMYTISVDANGNLTATAAT